MKSQEKQTQQRDQAKQSNIPEGRGERSTAKSD